MQDPEAEDEIERLVELSELERVEAAIVDPRADQSMNRLKSLAAFELDAPARGDPLDVLLVVDGNDALGTPRFGEEGVKAVERAYVENAEPTEILGQSRDPITVVPSDPVRVGGGGIAEGEGMEPDRNLIESGFRRCLGGIYSQKIRYLAFGCRWTGWLLQRFGIGLYCDLVSLVRMSCEVTHGSKPRPSISRPDARRAGRSPPHTQLVPSADHTHRFDTAADAYASGRPGYPSELASWLRERAVLETGASVLDLGAGTGELTAILIEAGFDVTAIEPSAPMRAVLRTRFPGTRILDEPAESLSADDGSFDLITVANALHWFNPATAFPEIARVMGEKGKLAVIWNTGDTEDPLQAKLDEIREDLPSPPLYDWSDVGDAPTWDELMEPVAETTLPYLHRLSHAAVADYVCSWSVVANMSDAEQRPIRKRALSLAGDGDVTLRFKVSATLHRCRIGGVGAIA